MTDNFESVPETSEQLDQLEAERSLVDRGLEDDLEEGIIAPDHWSPGEGYGNTAAEMREGETLSQRLKQEVPDRSIEGLGEDSVAEDDSDDGYVEAGDERAGRLVDANHGYPGEDLEDEMIGEDVGIDGAGASAEEAAVHIVNDFDYSD